MKTAILAAVAAVAAVVLVSAWSVQAAPRHEPFDAGKFFADIASRSGD